jgi:hypothetical protein
MLEPIATRQYRSRRSARALVLGVTMALGLLLAACPMSLIAIQQRVIAPPAFAFRLGNVEFAAPCPTREFICDAGTPWYAIWRTEDMPDGTTIGRQLFFVYLRPKRSVEH